MPPSRHRVGDADLSELRDAVSEALRMHAVLSRRLERHGLPAGSTLEQMSDWVDAQLTELDRRRETGDGALGERLMDLARRYDFAHEPASIDWLLNQLDVELGSWSAMKRALRASDLGDVVYRVVHETQEAAWGRLPDDVDEDGSGDDERELGQEPTTGDAPDALDRGLVAELRPGMVDLDD